MTVNRKVFSGEHITLVGGGLAGSLLSVSLARRGCKVNVYERRPDMRKEQISAGRSINLALSTRGIHALKEVGLYDRVMNVAIPMKGRMIHAIDGTLMLQPYGKDESEVIFATSRGLLNCALLDAAEAEPGVLLKFNERCTGMDFQTGDILFHNEVSGTTATVPTSVVIGTDGSASAIRTEMQKGRFNFSQHYLDYGYKELSIPPAPGGGWLMEKNALHIWPRTTFMLIALPNMDGSFTCTLFYPFEGVESFQTLHTPGDVRSLFQKQFPDALSLMPTLIDDFFGNPTGAMVTIKCDPWHVGGTAALLGDAAHAIVPFFGQGMNCAFEDCTYLNSILRSHARSDAHDEQWWEGVFREFEMKRKKSADAIADLAVENFVEMRDLVATQGYQFRKKIERSLEEKFPDRFVPKYSMVTFHRIPYEIARERGRIQDAILAELAKGISNLDEVNWKWAESLVKSELPAWPVENEVWK